MVPGVVLGVLGDVDDPPIEPELPEPVLPELEPEPELPEPMLPELEPVLPEPVVLPEPEVLPYCLTQSSRLVPVRPTHWLGVADGLEDELEPVAESEELEPDDDAPLPEEPEPSVPLELLPALPPTLGLVVELPLPVLPEVCAHDAAATPSRAAATAALSVFAITM